MKQFNLFPVARGIVAIIPIHINIHIGKGQAHNTPKKLQKNDKKNNNTYNSLGDLELILNSRQTVEFKNNTFKLQKNKFIRYNLFIYKVHIIELHV